MPTEIKICGLSDPEGVDAALEAGADYLGFVFFAASPRNLSPHRAAELAGRVRGRAGIVALTGDADDATLDAIVAALRPDLLQFHGRESPERVAFAQERLGRPVMKAIGLRGRDDLLQIAHYDIDRVLFDAKPSPDATRPGGNGSVFDWSILQYFEPPIPWFLSGGLDADNVGSAILVTGTLGVDVSSGVESAPGKKDPALIQAFVAAVRAVEQPWRAAAGAQTKV